MPKTDRETRGLEREVLVAQKDYEISELQKSIREDEIIEGNENEQPSLRERARERKTENRKQIEVLENEREKLEEGLSLREKVKNIFKRYGFLQWQPYS